MVQTTDNEDNYRNKTKVIPYVDIQKSEENLEIQKT